MLVLSRKKNQSIRIGDGIEVVVSQIKGNCVRLAISAPPSVPIFRQEVIERMEKEADPPSKGADFSPAIRPAGGVAQTAPSPSVLAK